MSSTWSIQTSSPIGIQNKGLFERTPFIVIDTNSGDAPWWWNHKSWVFWGIECDSLNFVVKPRSEELSSRLQWLLGYLIVRFQIKPNLSTPIVQLNKDLSEIYIKYTSVGQRVWLPKCEYSDPFEHAGPNTETMTTAHEVLNPRTKTSGKFIATYKRWCHFFFPCGWGWHTDLSVSSLACMYFLMYIVKILLFFKKGLQKINLI